MAVAIVRLVVFVIVNVMALGRAKLNTILANILISEEEEAATH
jgi:hypothetical protein